MKTSISLITAFALGLHSAGAYQLHEWGTFTTVAGSDGVLLSGLQREEEHLPAYVHSHFGFENGAGFPSAKFLALNKSHGFTGFTPFSKGLGQRPVANVTVKMETPVIYFHSDKAFRATVKVGFEGGTISQWYPARSGGETLPEPPPSEDPLKKPVPVSHWQMDFAKPHRGSIQWDVDVLSPEESRTALTFKPRDTVNWLRARVPEANVVRTDSGEMENYLFYRGVGGFTPGLHTTVSADETLHLHNRTGGDIPYLLVFEQRGGKVSWSSETAGLAAGKTLDLAESRLTATSGPFPTEIYQSLKSGLTACGLLESEADAMVQTWWNSYFETEGLRVFWIVPSATTDRILPLDVSPQPEKIVRVLVGRSEVLRPRSENEWVAQSKLTGNDAHAWNQHVQSDRFGLAIRERVSALGKATAAK